MLKRVSLIVASFSMLGYTLCASDALSMSSTWRHLSLDYCHIVLCIHLGY